MKYSVASSSAGPPAAVAASAPPLSRRALRRLRARAKDGGDFDRIKRDAVRVYASCIVESTTEEVAASAAATAHGLYKGTVRRWASWVLNHGAACPTSLRGKASKLGTALDDKSLQSTAFSYVLSQINKKGTRFTVATFAKWLRKQPTVINAHPKLADATARRFLWRLRSDTSHRFLRRLGFKVSRGRRKSCYVDGHER